jgi:GGDEF domain-containing protein
MPSVRLGNPNPQMQVRGEDGEKISVPAEHLNQSITRVDFVASSDPTSPLNEAHADRALSTQNDRVLSMIGRTLPKNLRRYALAVNEVEQIVAVHMGGDVPDWVACDEDPDLEAAIAEHFGCARGEPTALITNGGRDLVLNASFGTAAQPAAANYMAVSANASAESAANTTLPGEITTAGGGLLRAQATYAHTAGTNTATLTKTFTANGSDSLPVTLAKIGVLNASSSGTLAVEKLLSSTAVLSASGDNVAITYTLTYT